MMQRPIRCIYNGVNLTFPMGALPMERGAVMKCPRCPSKRENTMKCPCNEEKTIPVKKIRCSACSLPKLTRAGFSKVGAVTTVYL